MNVLVTGGGGFLGGAIVRQLLTRGDTLRSFSRSAYDDLKALGVEQHEGDLEDADLVRDAVRGVDVVIHTAAKTGVWGAYYDYYETNVVGTQNVIEACQQTGVTRLVYTSSPAVAFRGVDQEGVDESGPVPEKFLCHYAKTKAMAEQLILQATQEGGIQTVSLRPHLIWGPGDTQLVPRIIERAKAGRLRLVGRGAKLVDTVYVDNAARAHLLAADRLDASSPCAGKAYYITNGEPWPMKKIIDGILKAAKLKPVEKSIPAGLAYAMGGLMELAYSAMRRDDEPPMTRFVARQLATAHWYDIGAAKRDLEYTPEVSMEEGMTRLAKSLAG